MDVNRLPDQDPTPTPSWGELRTLNDTDLMRELMHGNHDAISVIIDRYHRLVFSVAVRILKNEIEAEDVVQNVFLSIFRNAAQFDPSRGILKMWILQYAYSRSLNWRRDLEHQQFYSQAKLQELDSRRYATPSLDGNRLSSEEAARLVEQGLAMLSERQRKAIEFVFFEGMTFPEAGAKTGETVSALRHNYYRALMKLRVAFRPKTPRAKVSEIENPEQIQMGTQNLNPRTI